MTAPSLLDELEGIVRLAEKATPGPFVVDGYGDVTANGEDVARIASDGYSAYHDAHLFADAANFIRARHAEIADMAKRLEAAERDSKRLDFMEREHCTVRVEATCDDDVFYEVVDYYMAEPQERVIGSGATPRDALDAAIDATQEGEE